MRRRAFIFFVGGAAVSLPFAARAQAPALKRRIAVIAVGTLAQPPLASLVEGLRELGYVAGRNIEFEPPLSNADFAGFAQLAARAVERKSDVIVSYGTTATDAARRATKSIPIVMVIGSDPVQLGFVKSLGRPDANLTGVAQETQALAGKRIELIKEIVPAMRRLAVVVNPASANITGNLGLVEQEAKRVGVSVLRVEIRSGADFDAAGTVLSRAKADAMLIVPSSLFVELQDRLVALAAVHKIPAVHAYAASVRAGGLISYASDLKANFRHAAVYVDRILKGAKPGDLPIEQPTKFELVLNMKTARALGLKIPQSVLVRADEVIE